MTFNPYWVSSTKKRVALLLYARPPGEQEAITVRTTSGTYLCYSYNGTDTFRHLRYVAPHQGGQVVRDGLPAGIIEHLVNSLRDT